MVVFQVLLKSNMGKFDNFLFAVVDLQRQAIVLIPFNLYTTKEKIKKRSQSQQQ